MNHIFAAMYINCNEEELFVLDKISTAATELGMPCYLIGGLVRDKILGRSSKDIDIVCVGDGIMLAEKVAQMFKPVPQISIFKNFGTSQLKLKNFSINNSASQVSPPTGRGDPIAIGLENPGGFEIEFVGARKESYNMESRKPDVEQGTLEDDQDRRDFTINALAISLNKNDFGQLIDPFDGLSDLEKNNQDAFTT
ncbi:MAG: hypothetical protein WKF59_12040 [Chitinophagaceae bacterium]